MSDALGMAIENLIYALEHNLDREACRERGRLVEQVIRKIIRDEMVAARVLVEGDTVIKATMD